MAASFPGAIKNFSAVVNGVTKLVAALFNSPYDEITAIETELGTDVAGSAADLKTRLAIGLSDAGVPKVPANLLDYGTSLSAYTARTALDLKICYGAIIFTANGQASVTNLPFTSAVTYVVIPGYVGLEAANTSWDLPVTRDSGAQFTVDCDQASTYCWLAVGV